MHHVKSLVSIAAACILLAPTSAVVGAQEAQLAERSSRYLDHVSVLPGADFRGYSKVFLQPASVSFDSNWLKDMNAHRIALLRVTTQKDADEIAREAAKALDRSLARALRQAGFEVVREPGPEAVVLAPRITNLYVNAPSSINTQPGRTLTTNAGRGAFAVEVGDSTTGRLLVQIADQRIIGDRGAMPSSMRMTTPATNAFDFETTFDRWTHATAKTLEDLRKTPVAALRAQ